MTSESTPRAESSRTGSSSTMSGMSCPSRTRDRVWDSSVAPGTQAGRTCRQCGSPLAATSSRSRDTSSTSNSSEPTRAPFSVGSGMPLKMPTQSFSWWIQPSGKPANRCPIVSNTAAAAPQEWSSSLEGYLRTWRDGGDAPISGGVGRLDRSGDGRTRRRGPKAPPLDRLLLTAGGHRVRLPVRVPDPGAGSLMAGLHRTRARLAAHRVPHSTNDTSGVHTPAGRARERGQCRSTIAHPVARSRALRRPGTTVPAPSAPVRAPLVSRGTCETTWSIPREGPGPAT